MSPEPVSVLLVDPDVDDRGAAVTTLTTASFSVACESTFASAKAFLERHQPSVLLTTVRLGEYNGLHLVLRAKSARPEIVAIVTSPVPDHVLEVEARALGALFMVKPVSSQELIAAVMRGLYDRQPDAIRPPFERRERDRRIAEQSVSSERRRAPRRRQPP